MENKIYRVGMADAKVTQSPGILTTIGLGSCVGIVLYDPLTKIAGLVHIMLPYSDKISDNSNKLKFADTGIQILIEEMVKIGANSKRLI
ncbi:MAG: chemotaxis protein CheD, partial [Thermoanaerobacter sp.]|nr:chemotaxis protein CheD [Thermoanaerobacter sp.]